MLWQIINSLINKGLNGFESKDPMTVAPKCLSLHTKKSGNITTIIEVYEQKQLPESFACLA